MITVIKHFGNLTGLTTGRARWITLVGLMLLLSTLPAQAQKAGASTPSIPTRRNGPTPTPPMGWNSWDSYGTAVTEPEVKANADYMARRLARYGWQYIVVDIQWYEPQAKAHGYREGARLILDNYGRLLPATNRFPSASGGSGFKPLADYIHSKGLKFGIHIMRGIPRQAVGSNLPVLGAQVRARDVADKQSTCAWNSDMYGVDMSKPGGQAYYDSIVALYAKWGVDYIKADDMSRPFHVDEIAALSRAVKKSGRPIVLSLSPGPADVARAKEYQSYAQLWRISDDFWDRWEDLKRQFDLCRRWSSYTGPNSWPDADMLPLGRIGIRAERGQDRQTNFTKDEQVTLMTLWSIFRSPLMFGGDLPSNDAFTLSLVTNEEVLAVNQRSAGNHELFSRGNEIAWVADVPGTKDKYLAVFNLDDGSAGEIKIEWRELGLNGQCAVRDLWKKSDLGIFSDGFAPRVNPHGAALYKVRKVK